MTLQKNAHANMNYCTVYKCKANLLSNGSIDLKSKKNDTNTKTFSFCSDLQAQTEHMSFAQ